MRTKAKMIGHTVGKLIRMCNKKPNKHINSGATYVDLAVVMIYFLQ